MCHKKQIFAFDLPFELGVSLKHMIYHWEAAPERYAIKTPTLFYEHELICKNLMKIPYLVLVIRLQKLNGYFDKHVF